MTMSLESSSQERFLLSPWTFSLTYPPNSAIGDLASAAYGVGEAILISCGIPSCNGPLPGLRMALTPFCSIPF